MARDLHERFGALRASLARVVRGKPAAIDTLITALAANGSVLMEDVPGTGKTTLAKALAMSIEARFHRIQFTPDLLPGDILGSSIYRAHDGAFTFRPGPIFCHVLLADEINRASPRTQSALLEAMNEGQATIEGVTYPLEQPFLVIATENPVEYQGTYPLPEAEVDRFLVQVSLGYPSAEHEAGLLADRASGDPLDAVEPVLTREEVTEAQARVRQVTVDAPVVQYIVALAAHTRNDVRLALGASPRASLMLMHAAQAAAFLDRRGFVLPDDVQALAPSVLAHRLVLTPKAKFSGVRKWDIVLDTLKEVPVPV